MASGVKTPREMFLHELGDVLSAERTIERMLAQQQGEAHHPRLKRRLGRHREETHKHVQNIEQAFAALEASAHGEPCPAIDGIKTEHERSKPESAPAEMADLFLVGSAARVEHYEIAAYESLVTMAEAMDEKRVVRLLERNLKQEQRMLQDAHRVAKELAPKALARNGRA
jgi:ferritin-like metal-binding protein YciE